jgi:hypothetical protein
LDVYNKTNQEVEAPLSLSQDATLSSKRISEEIVTPSGWGPQRPEIDEASEFGIPGLAEIDSKIDASGSSYRDIFLDIETINFENKILSKGNKKPVDISTTEDSSKEMLKLVPKQVLTRQNNEQSKFANNSPEVFKKKICNIDNNELSKPVESIKMEDAQSSLRTVSSKSPPSVKRKSPARKDRDNENRGKSSSKNPEKDCKDKKEYQSRSSRRSPISSSWDSKEPIRSGSTSRNASLSRSRSRSRSPRKRDDRSKPSHGKRDKRSPAKQSSSYRGNICNLNVNSILKIVRQFPFNFKFLIFKIKTNGIFIYGFIFVIFLFNLFVQCTIYAVHQKLLVNLQATVTFSFNFLNEKELLE